MAIYKAINYPNAGREKLLETLTYVSNPKKNHDSESKTEDFQRQTLVNRGLCGKKNCKRHFKQFVLSMKAEWPFNENERRLYEDALEQVAYRFGLSLMEQGFITECWVHHNTKHPHFHMLLETCNAYTGKQFSQSTTDLKNMKRALNVELRKYKFQEEILGDIEVMTEEELFAAGEDDFYVREPEWFEENQRENTEEDYNDDNTNYWNTGTLEHPKREMVTYAWESNQNWMHGREMVRIVTAEEQKHGREMVKIVSNNKHNSEYVIAKEYVDKVAAMMMRSKNNRE